MAADVILNDGTQVEFDLKAITMKEWRRLFDAQQDDTEAAAILGKFAHLEAEYVSDLSVYDWKLFLGAAIKKVNSPLANPT